MSASRCVGVGAAARARTVSSLAARAALNQGLNVNGAAAMVAEDQFAAWYRDMDKHSG